jgi:hypothetical protein
MSHKETSERDLKPLREESPLLRAGSTSKTFQGSFRHH